MGFRGGGHTHSGVGLRSTIINASGVTPSATGEEALAFGMRAAAAGIRSIAVGSDAFVDAAASGIAVGDRARATLGGDVAIGVGAEANETQAIAFGASVVNHGGSVGLASDSTDDSQIAIGSKHIEFRPHTPTGSPSFGRARLYLDTAQQLVVRFDDDPTPYVLTAEFHVFPLHLGELNPEPAAPDVNEVLIYARDNGAGKTQVVARFATGAVQVMATEP